MKLTIPYQYTATYVRKGRRLEDRATRIGRIEVNIPDIPVSEAECVFEVGQNLDFRYDNNPFRNVAGHAARVWLHEGRHYVQRERVERMLDLFCEGNDGLGNPFNTSGRTTAPKPFEHSRESAEKQEETRERIMEKHALRSWNDDGGIGLADAIRRRAAELAVIDGWLCVPVSEPVLCVGELGDWVLAEGSKRAAYLFVTESVPGAGSAFEHRSGMDDGDQFRRFPLTDLDAARAYGAALAEAGQWEFEDVAIVDRVDADRVTFRSEAEAVGRAAQIAVWALSDHLAELPARTGLAVRALKDAVTEAGDCLVTPDMIYGLERLVECLPSPEDPWISAVAARRWWRSEGRIENWSDETRGDRHVEIARTIGASALTMWHTRAPGGEWVNDALPVPCHYDGTATVSQVVSVNEVQRLAADLGLDEDRVRSFADRDVGHLVSVRERNRSALAVLVSAGGGYEVLDPIGEGGRKAPWARVHAEAFAQAAELAVDAGLDLAL